MASRTQITLPPELQKRARERAQHLGISLAEYLRRLVARDLGERHRSVNPSVVFNLGRARPSDIAAEKDRMIGEAVAAERSRRS